MNNNIHWLVEVLTELQLPMPAFNYTC